MDRSLCALMGALSSLSLLAGVAPTPPALAQDANAKFDPAVRPAFAEPVTLASKDGVLEVTLTARQGEATLDTVATPVKNALLFSYEVVRGTASNGRMSGTNLYPSPTLQVSPGETLIVHLENDLRSLSIRDFFDPKYTAKGEKVPLYPSQMQSSPLNLHVHGLHVSPKGNSDNVMLHIPGGMANTYTYRIPKDHPQGAYWYHSHLHGLTTAHVYFGLAGLLAIGRTDGNIPLVTEKQVPIRNMLLQYNYVFDRAGGLAQFNNVSWPQWVSTQQPPKKDELAKGTYRPLLSPVSFLESKKGTQHATVWYSGPLSIDNARGTFQFIPSNLQNFTALEGAEGKDAPANPSLPDHRRDVQFTVNGQFQPVIKSKAGQTEIWVLANISDMAYMNVQLTETATGKHPRIAIVGTDGNPSDRVRFPLTNDGTRLLIPPASRYAIAVTIPDTGELVLEMPAQGGGAKTINRPAILYTNDGTENPPATLGFLSVLPSAVSYADGFFVSPTQVLAKAVPSEGQGVTTGLAEGQPLHASSSFEDISEVTPDLKRELLISGGFLNNLASTSDPKAFVYAFAGNAFPNVPLLQPRLDSIEEWTFPNENNDEHPIHIHVNDFQVTNYFDPTTGTRTGPEMWGVDNANVPAPTLGSGEAVVQQATLSLRTQFKDYVGLFVMHCHRLNHEDNGLMTLVNVIPAASTYAVAIPGSEGRAAEVKVYDADGDRLVASITPFKDFAGTLSVVMGEIDDDGVYDLIVGAGKGHAPEVVAYSGKAGSDTAPFKTELARFEAFPSTAQGGVTVASSQIDGSTADNIIVGSGPGIPSEVRVYRADLPATLGTAPELFSTFSPYPDDVSGVSVASGFVDFSTGRYSIVTAPGPGRPAQVKVFNFSLMTPIDKPKHAGSGAEQCRPGDAKPAVTNSFMPFGMAYRGGLSLATGWLEGSIGGAERIVVGQMTSPGEVRVFSSGSALQGGPAIYLANAEHSPFVKFTEAARLMPPSGAFGSRVATTSTTAGADLLVSGFSGDAKASTVRKYRFARPTAKAVTLQADLLGEVLSASGAGPVALGGD